MFSIIFPFDIPRLPLFKKTLMKYKEFGVPSDTEFIIVTRHKDTEEILMQLPEGLNYRVIQYVWDKETFNPSLALNLGVKAAIFDNIIITCPEVMPMTNVLEQLSKYRHMNILCQCFDEGPDGNISISLVNSNFRSEHPGMYFLAKFNKEDILKINGFEMTFMDAYASEDVDFGHRFVRAGLKFEMHDEIQARHQYHPRGDGNSPAFYKGLEILNYNDSNGIIRARRGIDSL